MARTIVCYILLVLLSLDRRIHLSSDQVVKSYVASDFSHVLKVRCAKFHRDRNDAVDFCQLCTSKYINKQTDTYTYISSFPKQLFIYIFWTIQETKFSLFILYEFIATTTNRSDS